MKKRLFAALITVVMIVSLMPFAVSATAAEHDIEVRLVKASDTTVRLDFYYKSGTDLPKSQMIHLKYDTQYLYPIMNGKDVTANLKNLSTNWASRMTTNNYQTPAAEGWEGFEEASEVILYGIVQDSYGYFIWKVEEKESETIADIVALPEYTLMSSLTMGVREGVDFNSFPTEAIDFSDPKNDFAVTSAQQIVDIWTKDGAQYQYGPRTGEGTLDAPAIVAGEGVKFAGSEPEVPEELKLTFTADKTDSGVSATATLANNFKTGDPKSALVIVAAYDADGLVAVNSGTQTVAVGASIGLSLNVTEDFAGITEVKAFLWSNFADRTPLCSAEVVSFTAAQ